MPTEAERELRAAALALTALRDLVPASGARMHRGLLKTTYLIECEDGRYVACRYRDGEAGRRQCARAAAGLDAAAAAGLGPVPLHPEGSPLLRQAGHWWTGYAFLQGPALWGDRPLDETYRAIGGLAARWHARCHGGGDGHRDATQRFAARFVPREAALRVAAAGADCPPVFLHGDLNAGNIILTPEPRAIDFDEVGWGPPELDLAIALGYVNTSPQDLRGCFHALLGGYRQAGGAAEAERVRGLAEMIPWYMAASQEEAMGGPLLSQDALAAAAAQAGMICAALAGSR